MGLGFAKSFLSLTQQSVEVVLRCIVVVGVVTTFNSYFSNIQNENGCKLFCKVNRIV